jgi:hypothetical protein
MRCFVSFIDSLAPSPPIHPPTLSPPPTHNPIRTPSQAYVAAIAASVATAVGVHRLMGRIPSSRGQGVMGRLAPLLAMAAAHCVSIPLMRQVPSVSASWIVSICPPVCLSFYVLHVGVCVCVCMCVCI